ncbi:type I-MYXAN CRISPR-associated Cas8a1/Cmx1 [Chloracidobacterium thermophilum]|uniref:type I-MYXAN CRISPR-associated Cas8a1/Cmx1 n=1 Tax=Chloracidobacterium thermophilum TaxID=458033 RepID=UPI0007388CB4|nr:type I-MYXAN CRISPR-associated Cas8a1/Cmx1 [Chloracidobacterium thermophilum]
MGQRTTGYQLPNPLVYELGNPNFTAYHRAALGGLAATIEAWKKNPRLKPAGIEAEVDAGKVEIRWNQKLSDRQFIRRLLEASFRLTPDKLIDLPGQGIETDRDDLRLAIHTGLCGTFLQHNKMRPGEKTPRTLTVQVEGDEQGHRLTYKAVDSYAHQKAQGTGLLDGDDQSPLSPVASIPQSVVPGAMTGASELEGTPEEVLLLLYLMVGSAVFLLRSYRHESRAQYCLVIPDVKNLKSFARNLRQIAARGANFLTSGYLGRIAGGAEEAALRFLMDIEAGKLTDDFGRSVAGCLAVAMGKVAWDRNQVNRSLVLRVGVEYPELEVFRVALQYFGKGRMLTSVKGETFAAPSSPLPELIAANLAAERHWCAGFTGLCQQKKDFERLTFHKGGLAAMTKAIKDEDDRAIIAIFHEAWRMTMGALSERAQREGSDFTALVERERERTRNAILRAKTAEALAGWFLRFCADATKGAALAGMKRNAARVREFIFNPRNFEQFQNLLLFALVSYVGREDNISEGGIDA